MTNDPEFLTKKMLKKGETRNQHTREGHNAQPYQRPRERAEHRRLDTQPSRQHADHARSTGTANAINARANARKKKGWGGGSLNAAAERQEGAHTITKTQGQNAPMSPRNGRAPAA